MADERFSLNSGLCPFTGNELILKGGLEGEMALLTGYPGSPVSDVFDSVAANRDLLAKHGVLGQMANNEALAAARLNGARLGNLRAVAVMKSVGMHVAADGLAIGNLTEPRRPKGGALVVVGDDPWNDTTQINSDSRFLAQHLHLPILEPATFQEIKDWMAHGLELSGHSDLYVAYVITTNQADGGGGVEVRPNRYPAVNLAAKAELLSRDIPVSDFVMIPPHTSQKEATLAGRFARFLGKARELGLNRTLYAGSGRHPLGFVVSGMSYCYLEHALFEMGVPGTVPILKFGVTHPLDKELLKDFFRRVERVVVVEEKRPFLESQVRCALQEAAQSGPSGSPIPAAVHGKDFPAGLPGIPEVRGLNPSILIERLGPLLLELGHPAAVRMKDRILRELELIRRTAEARVHIPQRTPTFCPGCPHRDSAAVSLKLKKNFSEAGWMKAQGRGQPTDVIFHGESGCHSMLQFAPNEGLMQDYSGMGLGGGTGAGIDPFVKNKQVVFLGDSTFFHSGMIAVSDSLKNGQDITYVVLDNKTTAMTGHQPTPGNDFDVMGRKTLSQDIEKIIRAMAGGGSIPVVRADPSDRAAYTRLLEDLVARRGVKVVIADKECAITSQRRLKRARKSKLRDKGFLAGEEHINITPEVCEYCLECANSTGCPGLSVEETDFGPKIVTDLSSCVADGACAKGQVCPSFESVKITRKRPPKRSDVPADPGGIPLPAPRGFDGTYCVSTFAVGGMGAGVVSAALVRAGINEGYRVQFLDKKGLAIRNGGVYGHILFSRLEGQVFSPVVPYGRADLLLGIDLLEAARGVDPKMNLRVASPSRTAAVVNTHKTETVLSLMGRDRWDPADLEKIIRSRVREDGYFGTDFSAISQSIFHSKLYANMMMVGAAFQRGLVPVSFGNLAAAVRDSVPAQDLEENLRALDLGRRIAHEPERFGPGLSRDLSAQEILDRKSRQLSSLLFGGKGAAKRYRAMVQEAMRWMHLDERANRQLALRAYELIRYEGAGLAGKYLTAVWDVYRKDRADYDFAATRAVIENLFKVMAIKDEVYVSHLLTAPEKLARDRARYRVDPANGDRISYVHLNRPRFDLWGWEFEFELRSRNWMLHVMKRMKFLRKVLPGWHAAEKSFRDWYRGLAAEFNYYEDPEDYRAAVEILKIPEMVRGYREIRYPLMDLARARVRVLREGLRGKAGPDAGPARPGGAKDAPSGRKGEGS